MSRASAIRVTFAVLAIGFFATPIAARVIGITAEPFENRRLAEAPRLSQGWSAFQQTSRYLVDHMPLRAQAVRANTRIWNDVFDADPNYAGQVALADDQALPFAGNIEHDGLADRDGPTARTGREGWAYLDEDFEVACDRSVTDREAVARWGRLVNAIRSAGHESTMFVAPSKASVYPEHLPSSYPLDHCALRGKERFWRALEAEGPAVGVIGLRRQLLRLKNEVDEDVFQRSDSHWTTLGAITLVRAALEAVGDGVELHDDEIVARGEVAYTGDLSVIGGRSGSDERMEYEIARARGAPRVPGRTLLICDSFAYEWMRIFKPYFEDIRYVTTTDLPRRIVAELDRADTVIVEASELIMKAQGGVDGRAAELLEVLERHGY